MIRTQIYLTEDQARDIKLRSQQERKPEAQLIRELLDAGLSATSKPRQSLGNALLELAELGKKLGVSGPTDLSTNLDEYLYGNKK